VLLAAHDYLICYPFRCCYSLLRHSFIFKIPCMRIICYLFSFILLFPVLLWAQPGTVTGKVTNAKGIPISGATVTLKGTNTRTLTAESGTFSIAIPGPQSRLLISYIGYSTKEIPVIAGQAIAVTLEQSVADLDDVVVQAYGTTTRRFNTGSIGRVTAADLEKQPVTNPLSALQGRVPGVFITASSGVPGAEVKVEIRGRGSLDLALSRNDPLYVIDNVPFEPGNAIGNQLRSAATSPLNSSVGGLSPLNAINPADIESIEVLKDADATAIYGSRGANGVILITTKKGRPGKTRFNLNSSFGVSSPARSMELLSTADYLALRREAFTNDNRIPTAANAPDLLTWDTTRYTDLQQLLIGRSAFSSFTQASLSGGSASTQFSIAGGYNRQTNVFSSSLADQVRSARLTLNHTSIDKKLNFLFSGIYSSDKNNLVSTDLTRYTNLPPNIKLYDSLGNINWSEGGLPFANLNFINPLSVLLQPYSSLAENLSANINIGYQLYTGLTLRTSAGYNTYSTSETALRPRASIAPTQPVLGSSEFAGSTSKSYIVEPQLEYRRALARGNLSLLAGATFQDRSFTNYSFSGSNYTNDLLLGSINAAGQITASNTANDYRYSAVFGRANYAWKDNTYIVNLTGRKDASSRFGRDKRTALFGAAGGAMVFSNYAFIRQGLPFLSFGKIRGSYGITGNDQIGNYKYLNLWNPTTNTYQGVPGFTPASLYNADYSWEINRKLEGAVELGFFKDRLLFSAAYYRNRCSNQITSYQLPGTTGFDNIGRNLPALVQNSGWELLLSGKILRATKLEWSAALNLTVPKNRLLRFPGLALSSYALRFEEGKSLSLIRGYEYLGVDPQTGLYQFTDVNKDGTFNNTDFQSFGNLDPKLFGGLQNTFSYRGIELSIFFEFRQQTGRTYLSQLSNAAPGAELANFPVLVLDRWQKPGDHRSIQRAATNFNSLANNSVFRLSTSNGIYGDASYIRCKNVSLSYTLPASFTKKVHLESGRLFLHAQNLFVLTHYQGSDPETQNFYILPPLRSIVGGLQITL
jgi:TonB-dependent starch-binding outer membrane protein SusC